MSTRMPSSATRARRLEAWTIEGELLGSWEDAEASAVLALIAKFPAGEPMRCFNPGYAIWARTADGQVLFDLEFCFECFWVGVRQAGKRQHLVAFDADSPPAQELLARFKAFQALR
jgi:hypothetical protein